MSEKVTFQELIESLASETDNTKKFTHDFIKDFVAVINEGLEKDGKVNIAGFGKFELRKMEEREGFNPHTEEKITIPEHNKVAFKPYKDLREIVNAPYADREPEIIEEEETEETTAPPPIPVTDDNSGGDTPAKTEESSIKQDELENKTGEDEKYDELYGLAGKRNLKSSFEFDESRTVTEEFEQDIVEYISQDQKDDLSAKRAEADKSGVRDLSREKIAIDNAVSKLGEYIVAAAKAEEERNVSEESIQISNPPAQQKVQPDEQYRIPDHDSESHNTILWTAAALFLIVILVGSIWLKYFQSGQETTDSQTENITNNISPTEQTTGENVTGRDINPQENGKPTDEPTVSTSSNDANDNLNVEIEQGQTLWSMADSRYDNPYLWPWIYGNNRSDITDPDIILAGQFLSIPLPDKANGDLSDADSLEVAIGYVESYKWYKNRGHDKAKYYLWAAKVYDRNVLEHVNVQIDEEDLAFANRVR